MQIAKPPCLRGLIRLQNAIEGLNPEERQIVWYDVKATMIYELQQLILQFHFKPKDWNQEIWFQNAVNVSTDPLQPHVRAAQLYNTCKHEYLLHGRFVMTNVYGQETDSWELVGKFKGQLPRAVECWDCTQ